jgi:hypothetical protein
MSLHEHPLWEEELMPFVDGELDGDQASRVAEHLKECGECSTAVDDAKRVSQQLVAWKIDEPSQQLADRVLAELRPQRGGAARRKPWVSWNRGRLWTYGLTGAAAALVLVVIAGVPGLRSSRSHELAYVLDSAPAAAPEASAWGGSPQAEGTVGQFEGRQALQALKRPQESAQREIPDGPMVIRTARLTAVTRDFDGARSKIEAIVRENQGYLDHLRVRGEAGSARGLSATLRLPSDKADAGLSDLRGIGKVQEESHNSSDVTNQVTDLRARLANARNTEQRLLNLLRDRTADLGDVLNAEREVARVREEIERMEAQQKDMLNKVQFATIQLELTEEYRATIEPSTPSAGTRLQNAMVDGYRGAVETALGIALFALRYGPGLLLWMALLAPFMFVLRRIARRAAVSASSSD